MTAFTRILSGFVFAFLLTQGIFAATYTVTKIADTNDGTCDADCSLREAITAANGTVDADIINFSTLFNTTQTITLGGTDLIITNNGTLTINGTGADKLTVSGNNVSRVFTNNTGAVTTINNLRVTGGTGVSTVSTGRGGGVYNSGGNLTLNGLVITGNTAANGGGANNAGTATLTVNNSTIFGNTATGAGGALQNFAGNNLNIYNSSIYNNTCNTTSSGGGGLQSNGTVNIVNSTFSGNNSIGGSGGAIYFNGTVLNITNSTFSANTSTNNAGITKTNANPLNIRNSIIASNNGTAAAPDFSGTANSLGNNIIGSVGSSTGWITSDLQNVNPILAPLGFYGGNGLSYALLSSSPALDAGQNCVTNLSCPDNNPSIAVTTDQRGAARPFNTTIDIGAFESNTNYTAILPTATLSQPYNFTLANNFTGFVYLITSGNLGGLTVPNNGNSAIVTGTPLQLGTFNAAFIITNNTNSINLNYSLTVLSVGATVPVNGRIFDASGNAVRGATVSLTDAGNVTLYARTNSFGNFNFSNIPFGGNYNLNANSKGLTFSPLALTVNAAPTIVNLTANNSNLSEFQR
jgi:CSLREA domain-containing protein